MLFNSYGFIFLYLPVVLLGFFQLARVSHAFAAHTLLACYCKVFMAFWNKYSRTGGGNITWPSGGLY